MFKVYNKNTGLNELNMLKVNDKDTTTTSFDIVKGVFIVNFICIDHINLVFYC